MVPEAFEMLDALFAAVDSYSPNCKAGSETDFEISEAELRRYAAKSLRALRRLRESVPTT